MSSQAHLRQRSIWLLGRLLPVATLLAAGLVFIFLLGLAQRLGWIRPADTSTSATAASADAIYTCPMHPQIRQPTPGRCPICGMALVPAASAGGDLNELAV